MTQTTLPAFPTRQNGVLRDLLGHWSEQTPNKTFVVFGDGETWSYSETASRAWAVASALRGRLGLKQRELICGWLPNGPEALLAWFGANVAGATYAPLNTAYKGKVLENALNLTRARHLVAHVDLLDRLSGLDLPHLETVVVVGGPTGSVQKWVEISWAELIGDGRATQAPELPAAIEVWDDMAVLLTSGTTGLSKAVRRTYVQYSLYTHTSFRHIGIDADDRFFVCGPMFHGGADTPIFAMLQLGGSVAIVDSFSASNFWQQVRATQSTVTWIHSAMSLFLSKQEPREEDLTNPLRLAMLAPLFPGWQDLATRYDFKVFMVYGMTEIPTPFSRMVEQSDHHLGRPVDPRYEIRLVDSQDIEVPPGTPGELIVRHQWPWAITPGYLNNAEATAAAWRNGWFHTGDVLIRTEGNEFLLVDRIKDSIRRRGENISSAEVEAELIAHPDVLEAAVVGVPADLEEDVLAFIIRRPGCALAPETVHQYASERLPYFAVPRYIAFLEEFPRSTTLRPDKATLRSSWPIADVWDREALGIKLERERLATSARPSEE